MSEQYTPTTELVRHNWGAYGAPREEFDRWLAEVERQAKAEAWDRCVGEMPIDLDWKIYYGDNNPYLAEAYRQERTEQ